MLRNGRDLAAQLKPLSRLFSVVRGFELGFSAMIFDFFEVAAMKRIGLAVLALGVVLGGVNQSAMAQGPYCGGYGLGWGANFPFGLYGSRVEDVPYFAMFPPVYYSMPVPRTYGWSPFAYPPGTMTPEVQTAVPEVIINPYVPQQSQAEPSSNKTASTGSAAERVRTKPEPKVIINPFVTSLKTASTK